MGCYKKIFFNLLLFNKTIKNYLNNSTTSKIHSKKKKSIEFQNINPNLIFLSGRV